MSLSTSVQRPARVAFVSTTFAVVSLFAAHMTTACATEVTETPAGEKGDVPALPSVIVSDASSTTDGASDSATSTSDASDASDAGVSIQGCTATSFQDHTADAAVRTLAWDFDAGAVPERCMTVQIGQSVTWVGNFTTHPLVGGGGDTPNPIGGAQADGGVATFPAAGIFGYFCDNHAFMKGAIQVVP